MEAICKNCDSTLQPDYEHCPKCGQTTHLHRLGMHDVFHEFVHYFTHADKGLFQLIRDLVVKNGVVAKEFIAGKRKKYYPPFTFFLLVAAIHVFVSNLHNDHSNVDVLKKFPELAEITNPVKQAKWIEFYERRENGIHFINKYANLITMVSLPITSFIFWLMYRRRAYNYTEHLVAGMFMFGFFTLVVSIVTAFGLLLNVPENYVYLFCILLEISYFTLFYHNFMESGKRKAFWASFFSILALFLVSFVVMSIYMFAIK